MPGRIPRAFSGLVSGPGDKSGGDPTSELAASRGLDVPDLRPQATARRFESDGTTQPVRQRGAGSRYMLMPNAA